MDPLREPIQFRVGDDVYGSDDHKVGSIVAFDTNVVTVEHGLLRKSEYYIPISAFNACNDGRCYLNVTKDEVAGRGWDAPPLMDTDASGRPLTG